MVAFLSTALETYVYPPTLTGRKYRPPDGVTTLPLLSFKVTDTEQDEDLINSTGVVIARVEFHCYGASYQDASILADRLHTVINRYSGWMVETKVLSCAMTNRNSGFIETTASAAVGVFLVISEFEIVYIR